MRPGQGPRDLPTRRDRPEDWKFVSRYHPRAYEEWKEHPNLEINKPTDSIGVTGPRQRFCVVSRRVEEKWDCWYLDKLGDGKWHQRDPEDPISQLQRKYDKKRSER